MFAWFLHLKDHVVKDLIDDNGSIVVRKIVRVEKSRSTQELTHFIVDR
jgi:hypothetical protein